MSDLKIIENLKITHCLKAQDIKYSTFKLYNSSSNLIYKNINLTAVSDKIDFKLSLNSLDTESEWSNSADAIFISQILPGAFIEINIRSVVKDTSTNPGIYDCKFETSYTTQGL